MNKALIILGHISLLLTIFLTVYFYQERVFYVDPGEQLFEMINRGNYRVFVERHSMMINQSLPLLGIKMGWSLRTIVILYSISFALIYYACFLISVYGFKNTEAGWVIAFVPLVLRAAFAHSISETWLAVVYSCLFYALINYYPNWKQKGWAYMALFYFLVLLLIAINYFIHPITLFTLGFTLGFTYFNRRFYREHFVYILAVIILASHMINFLFPSHNHNESFFDGVKHFDLYIAQIIHLPIAEYFAFAFLRMYWIPTLMFILIGLYYKRKKRWDMLLFVAGFTLIYLFIASMAFHKAEGQMGTESRLIVLILFAGIPLIEFIKMWKFQWRIVGLFIFVAIFGYSQLIRITHLYHTRRIDAYKERLEYVRQFPEKKFYTYQPRISDPAVNSWGSSVETLFLSSLDGPDNSRSIHYFWEGETVDAYVNETGCAFLWVPWWLYYDEGKLNPKYFNLGCTAYRQIPAE